MADLVRATKARVALNPSLLDLVVIITMRDVRKGLTLGLAIKAFSNPFRMDAEVIRGKSRRNSDWIRAESRLISFKSVDTFSEFIKATEYYEGEAVQPLLLPWNSSQCRCNFSLPFLSFPDSPHPPESAYFTYKAIKGEVRCTLFKKKSVTALRIKWLLDRIYGLSFSYELGPNFLGFEADPS